MFLSFAVVRIVLIQNVRNYFEQSSGPVDEQVLRIATDVEIHQLHLKVGYDLIALPLLGIGAFVVARRRGWSEAFVIAAGATILTSLLSLAMAYYPSLILSGRIGSPFQSYVTQNVAFATSAVISVAVAAFLFTVIQHKTDQRP
jgi:hypothetical protein